ncbi:hypothetical protein [Thermoflexibacter ruber]|uniref:Uncharacterized protein n=1 Tax=Thermoflexibacter ruber TaxID=1003 RepID=A0A1I2HF93_9BACT|nr:hypothetical protein [Thermoflexibacter ruber]SFF27587.1 hypothetical protein SAMN04488541_102334 [Thermoflexibacter ruber]
MKKQFYLDESDKVNSIFDAPKEYFENLPQKVNKRIQQSQKVPIWTLYLQPKYALIIASIVILLVAGVTFMNPNQEKSVTLTSLDFSTQEIKEYLLQSEIHEYDLVSFYLANGELEDEEEFLLEEEILSDDVDVEEIADLL